MISARKCQHHHDMKAKVSYKNKICLGKDKGYMEIRKNQVTSENWVYEVLFSNL